MIRVDDVSVRFGEKRVLDGVTLSVPEGCIYGLIGPGASGKSVLLKTIAGLLRPARGRVHLLGTDLTGLDERGLLAVRRDVGMLFQNYALFDFMTVGENIAFPLRRLFDLPEEEITKRVGERLARMSLPGFEDRMPGGLSGASAAP